MIGFQKRFLVRFVFAMFAFIGSSFMTVGHSSNSSLSIKISPVSSAEARPPGRGWPRGGHRDGHRPESGQDDTRGGSCNAFGCYEAGGGCNAFGCYPYGGGCNAFGCWQSPYGACNAFGCSNNGTCTAFGCP